MKISVMVKVLCLSIAVAVLASGCVPAQATQAEAETEARPIGTAVETSFVRRTTITNEMTYIGQVQPLKTVNVASMLVAEVTAVNFAVGDTVEEGDVLFTVDAQDIQNQIRQLNAAVQSLNIGVESAQYGLELALEGSPQARMQELQHEMGVQQAHTSLSMADESRSNISRQQRQLRDRLDDLNDERARLSREIVEFTREHPRYTYVFDSDHANEFSLLLAAEFALLQNSMSTVQTAIAQMEAQQESLRTAARQAQLSQRQAGIALDFAEESLDVYREIVDRNMEQAQRQAEFGLRGAQAQLETTQVQLSIARDNLNRATITSPISGVVSGRNVEVGQFVSQAMVPFTIVQMDYVIVQVNIAETLINLVYPGQQVDVDIQALGSEQTFTGTVTTVAPVANHASTFPVRIELENSDGLIRPGMFSRVTFVQSQSENTFVVPRSAVRSDADGQFVFVVEEDGIARRAPVQTGLQTGNEIEIISGVREMDQIVVMGQEFLYDGIIVNVVAVDGERVSVN